MGAITNNGSFLITSSQLCTVNQTRVLTPQYITSVRIFCTNVLTGVRKCWPLVRWYSREKEPPTRINPPIFIRPEGAANCLVCYCLPKAGLKTSHDWLRPEWENTRAEGVYLYQTLRAKRAQYFLRLNERSELISIGNKIDERSKWPSAVCAPKDFIWSDMTGMAKYTIEASVFVPNSTIEASPIFSETQRAQRVGKYYY